MDATTEWMFAIECNQENPTSEWKLMNASNQMGQRECFQVKSCMWMGPIICNKDSITKCKHVSKFTKVNSRN